MTEIPIPLPQDLKPDPDFQGRSLLVLGAGLMQRPLLALARAKGLRTVVFDANPAAPGRADADRFEPIDISRETLVAESALQLARHEAWAGVMTVGTDFSTSVSAAAAALGLPAHALEAARKAKDKALMRAALRTAGLPVPDWQEVEAGRKAEWTGPVPLVVKPVDSMGARGVLRVDDLSRLDEAVAAARAISPTGRVLLEEYIPGREYSLDALVDGPVCELYGLADRHLAFEPHFVELGHSFPCEAPRELREGLIQTFFASIRGLGLSCGAAKGDLKWHPDKGPMIGEIAARLSGGFMSGWTYPYHARRWALEDALDLALGRPLRPRPEQTGPAVVEQALISLPGQVRRCGEGQLRSLPGLQALIWQTRPGAAVKFPGNNVEKAANVLVTGDDLGQARARASALLAELDLRLEPGHPATRAWIEGRQGPPAWDDRRRDWMGVAEARRRQQFEALTGQSWSAWSAEPRHRLYWEQGGLQGGLYLWDSRP